MGGQSPHVLKRPLGKAAPVPFYRQSLDFTCGPACLIMAMRSFDPTLPATRELEIDIWREANLVEAYASSRQGLALAAHRRGFGVRTQGSAETIELLECLGLPLAEENRTVARALHEDVKARCREAGIPDRVRGVSLDDISGWLARSWVPLVLVDARLVTDEDVPHWVVVTACDRGFVAFHDPLASEGNSHRPSEEFASLVGFRGVSCAVVVEGLREKESAGTGNPG